MPVSEQAVMMAATHLLVGLYPPDSDEWAPLKVNKARNIALDDCAQMAWALAEAVHRHSPEVKNG